LYTRKPTSRYWRKALIISRDLMALVQRKPVKQNDYLVRFICLDVLELLYYQGIVHWNILAEYYQEESYFDSIINRYLDTFEPTSRKDLATRAVDNLRQSYLTFDDLQTSLDFIHLLRDDILHISRKGRVCRWSKYDGTLSLRLASAGPAQIWISKDKSQTFKEISTDWLNAFGIHRSIDTQSKMRYMRRILTNIDTLQNESFQLAYVLYLLTLRTELYRLSPEDPALSTLDCLIVNVQYA
jgi:hypothetical protein